MRREGRAKKETQNIFQSNASERTFLNAISFQFAIDNAINTAAPSPIHNRTQFDKCSLEKFCDERKNICKFQFTRLNFGIKKKYVRGFYLPFIAATAYGDAEDGHLTRFGKLKNSE